MRNPIVTLGIVGLALLQFSTAAFGSPNAIIPPTFHVSHGTPIKIETADKMLRARAPKARPTSLRTVAGKPTTSNARKTKPRFGIRPLVGLTSLTCTGTGQPVEIETLAASLKCDPDLIFEYVYNNIEYDPLFGSNKGALGTLLDQRGNDIDQAQLFAALLHAAGYSSSQVSFLYGYVRLNGAQTSNWLGVKNDARAILDVLGNGGIPHANAFQNPDGTLYSVDVAQVWLQVNIGGINYSFDPSFKLHTVSSGLSGLGTVLGYTQSQFLSDAGGTIDSLGISGVNRSAVRNDLNKYANNLIAYIKANNTSWSVTDVVGGKKIQYLTGSPLRQTSLAILAPSQPSGFPQNWGATVPNAYRTCFTISMPGVTNEPCSAATSQNILLYADETYGHRVTVFSTGGSCAPPHGSCTPTLLIDGAPPPNGQNTGTAQNYNDASNPWTLNVYINHPYAGFDETATLDLTAGGSYLVGAGWGGITSRGMIEKHRQLLAEAVANGGAASSESVLGESLAIISYSWISQVDSSAELMDAITKVTTQIHHSVGIAGQTPMQSSGNQGPYVDLPMNVLSQQQQTYVGGGSFDTFYTMAGISSSLESATLEQTQGLVPGMQAASTVKLVDMNVATGAKTFLADGTTSSGLSAYFATIRPSLVTNGYVSADLTQIDNAISTNGLSSGSPNGNIVLLPSNGAISVGSAPWTGSGYTIINRTTNYDVSQLISGQMSGGFSGFDISIPDFVFDTPIFTEPPSIFPTISPAIFPNAFSFAHPLGQDPVDSVTGAYLYTHADLTTGSGSAPYALTFSRNYSSASNRSDVGLGQNWAHNFDISIMRTSDPYAALGGSSPVSAASAIAGIYVAHDLLTGTLDAQHLTLSWVASRWLTDQLTNNAALVTQPLTSEEFIVLPHADGSSSVNYDAPLGSSSLLTGSVPDLYGNFTSFTYRNKDQSQLNFGTLSSSLVGQLSSWTMPNGMSLSFSYGYSYGGNTYLSSVSSNLGRRLNLAYSGPHLTAVTDDTGRSISYTYDANDNLSGMSDPLGFQTTFGYDGAGGHLTQIFYPSNPTNAFVTNVYDGLGRVNQQANANGSVYTYYLAGARSEIVDPASDRHVTYQTPRGSALNDDWVLSGSADVFNDTVQNNGVINVTTNQYDGQERLTLTTAPEGGTTGYTYSPDFLQNVVLVTNTPKPGSPLSTTTVAYTYDAFYNKTTSVTDALGLVSRLKYDPSTGSLLTTISDYGNSSHLNATAKFSYNSVGQVLSATDPNAVLTQYNYDHSGNQISVMRDVGSGHMNQLTSMTYDALGNLTSVTDPNGNITKSIYDADRRLASVTLPSALFGTLSTAYTYDQDGRVLTTQQSNSGTVLRTAASTYTFTGKTATVTDANGNVTKYSYDAVDRVASVIDPVGNATIYGYDALSRQTSIANPAIQTGALLQKAYTPDGFLASLTDANSHSTSYSYDGLDRLATGTYPNSSTETFTYDVDGNNLTRKTRKGDTITMTYDTLNRLSTKVAPSEPTVTYAYDLVGRLTAANDNSAAVPAASGSSASYSTNTTFDALNRPTNVSWTPTVVQTTPTASAVTFSHNYDGNNRQIGQAATDKSWFNYPTVASTVNYAANSLNQYSAVGSVTPTYDGNGNLTYDGSNTYCYDAENRLSSILTAGICASPTTTVATYAYDAQGRRKSKTVSGVTTQFVTDADNREVLEYNGSGATQRWYAYGQGSNDVLNQMNVAAGTRETMIPDIQGSFIGALDTGGALTKTGYQPYGENASLTSGTFNYTAQRFDAETTGTTAQPSGLYYYRARMYSPTWGRFLQADPMSYFGGSNLYAYANNDPLNNTDPSGLINNCYNTGACGHRTQAMVAQSYQIGNTIIGGGLAIGACIVACPVLAGGIAGGGAASVGSEAILGAETAATTTTTVAAPPTFSAAIGNTALDLAADPLAGTTTGTLVPSATPGLAGSPITDFDALIPTAPTNLGKIVTIIGSGLAFRNSLSGPAK